MNVAGGGRGFAYKQYPVGYATHTISFSLTRSGTSKLAANEYMIVAQDAPEYPIQSNAGKVDLILSGPSETLQVIYFDSSNVQHTIYTQTSLADGAQTQELSLTDIIDPAGGGAIMVSLDGKQIIDATDIDTGTDDIGYAGFGDVFTADNASTTGTLTFSDIVTSTSDPAVLPPPPSQVTPTPTPTETSGPAPSPTEIEWHTPTPIPTGPTATPTSPPSPTPTKAKPTPTPTKIKPAPALPSKEIFFKTFDGQKTGKLLTGPHNFTSVTDRAAVSVVSDVFYTPPHSLSVGVIPGAGAYAFKSYGASYQTHELSFTVLESHDFKLPSGGYLCLAATDYAKGSTHKGTVQLILSSNGSLSVTYWEPAGEAHYISTTARLGRAQWYRIALVERGGRDGSVQILVNGDTVGAASDVSISPGVSDVAVGSVYTPNNSHTHGTLYFDNVGGYR